MLHVGFCFVIDGNSREVPVPVDLRDLADHLAGIARGNAPGRDVLDHDASRADHRIVSDVYAGTNNTITADPDIVADRDADAVLVHGVARRRVDRVAGRVDRDIGRDLAVVADDHLGDVQDRAVVVGKKVLADFYIFTVVAVEGRVDPRVVRFAQQLLDDRLQSLEIGPVHRVELLAEPTRDRLRFHDRVVCDV